MSNRLKLQDSFGNSLLTFLKERGGSWPYLDALQRASYVADCAASSAKRYMGKLTCATGPLIVRMTREAQVLEIKKHWKDRRSSFATSDTLKRMTSTRTTKGADEICEGRDG